MGLCGLPRPLPQRPRGITHRRPRQARCRACQWGEAVSRPATRCAFLDAMPIAN